MRTTSADTDRLKSAGVRINKVILRLEQPDDSDGGTRRDTSGRCTEGETARCSRRHFPATDATTRLAETPSALRLRNPAFYLPVSLDSHNKSYCRPTHDKPVSVEQTSVHCEAHKESLSIADMNLRLQRIHLSTPFLIFS